MCDFLHTLKHLRMLITQRLRISAFSPSDFVVRMVSFVELSFLLCLLGIRGFLLVLLKKDQAHI